jgi:glutathione peroxidase
VLLSNDGQSICKEDDMAVINFDSEIKNGLQVGRMEFSKYLINEKGVGKVISPRTLVTDPEVLDWIKA